jgi:hypothetical protein
MQAITIIDWSFTAQSEILTVLYRISGGKRTFVFKIGDSDLYELLNEMGYITKFDKQGNVFYPVPCLSHEREDASQFVELRVPFERYMYDRLSAKMVKDMVEYHLDRFPPQVKTKTIWDKFRVWLIGHPFL